MFICKEKKLYKYITINYYIYIWLKETKKKFHCNCLYCKNCKEY